MKPLISIGIISCNRLHYLKVCIESARKCIQYPNLEWLVVDNASIEDGLQDYLRGLDFLDYCYFRPSPSPATQLVDALNRIIDNANGKYLMILPEDTQFIIRGEWMDEMVELLEKTSDVGTIVYNLQRRKTIKRYFDGFKYKAEKFIGLRRNLKTHANKGQEFWGYGRTKSGISPAGILSFTPLHVWRKLGPFKSTTKQTILDATGGGEVNMHKRCRKSGLKLERMLMKICPAADIVTDPRGTKARIRGNRRYGKYMAPPDGRFYYQIIDENELAIQSSSLPVAFEDLVKPVGYELPLDKEGNLLKNSYVDMSDPFEWVHPSVEGVDIF